MASDKPSRPPSSNPEGGPAWGATRDALAAVHNLGALLKSPRVSAATAAGVLPEVRTGCATLRDAFLNGQVTSVELGPRVALCAFAMDRIAELERALDVAEPSLDNAKTRIGLEQLAARLALELDAAIELLDLADRAARPVRTELSFHQIVRVALRHGTAIRPRETIQVRQATRELDVTLVGDAHVTARLMALAISAAHVAGAREVTLEANADPTSVRTTIRAAEPADGALPLATARVPRRIPPTAGVVRAAAEAVNATFRTEGPYVVLTLPRIF